MAKRFDAAELAAEEARLITEANGFITTINDARELACDTDLITVAEKNKKVTELNDATFSLCEKRFKGKHMGKIYSMAWSADDKTLLTAAQDGKLILWNTHTGGMDNFVRLKSNWVMACAYAPSGNLIASGGMDNECTIYDVTTLQMSNEVTKPKMVLTGHEGIISCIKFVSDTQILSSSGDGVIMLWDIAKGKCVQKFEGHESDVTSFALFGANTLISGSTDKTARLWDVRTQQCSQRFLGHEGDINSVSWFPTGTAFASASHDTSARLWDIRSDQCIAKFDNNPDDPDQPPTMTPDEASRQYGYTSTAFSKSGRLLFCGSYNGTVSVWDTLLGHEVTKIPGHDKHVSCIGISPSGGALATAGWDMTMNLWTQ